MIAFLNRSALLTGTLLTATVPSVTAQGMSQAAPPPLPVGVRAPAFATRTITGKPLSLQSLRGKVVLLDYWATWCGPCQMATPILQRLHRQFAGRGLKVIGMDVDDSSTVAQVKPFMRHFGITYTIAASPVDAKAAQAYHVDGIPAQFLIDKRGIVRWSQSGFSPSEGPDLSRRIQQLLAEKG